jgi:2-polyprenyl-3-methyl-5-hydroxy-6-metoxy-1,4-benzoquinol methylase
MIKERSVVLEDRLACPLCGGAETKVHRAFRDIPVVRCLGCGFLYSSRVMPPGQLTGYYEGEFGSERHRKGQIVNAATNLNVLAGDVDFAKVGSWLDIGTGYGYLLAALRDRYKTKVYGVELSKIEAKVAQETLGLNVATSLTESGFPKYSFDVVSSFEVIEHTENPIDFLRELSQYVRPGGRLIVMTDNFESPAVTKLAGGFPKWIPHTHISHFSARTLRRCIQASGGLEVEAEMSYTPPDLFARHVLSAFRTPPPDCDAFDLDATLATEMNREYRFFKIRQALNPLWARVTKSRSAEGGALMYMVCRFA